MKFLSKVYLVFVFFFLTITQTLLSQSDEGISLKPFGIGLHVEQFKIGDLSTVSEGLGGANKIIFCFNTNDNFRFEPEIGFIFGKNKNSDSNFEGVSLGAGLSKIKLINKFLFYYGVRLNYNYAKGGGEKIDILNFGPNIGGEYFLGEQFSFGGEFAVKYNNLKFKYSDSNYPFEDYNSESYYFSTESGLFIRFYF